MARSWRTRWAIAYGAGLVIVVACALIPEGAEAKDIAYQVVTLGAIAVLLLSILRMPSRARPVWWAVLAYASIAAAGDLVYDVQSRLVADPTYPGIPDALYLASYAAGLIALGILIRKVNPGRDLEAWIDTAIMAIAATAVVGMLVVQPIILDTELTRPGAAVSIAYPLVDILLLAGLVRLLIGRGRVNPAIALLCAAFSVTFLADLLYSYVSASGLDSVVPRWLDSLYLAAYVTMAAAASAPGARRIVARPSRARDVNRPTRTLALAVGALTVPVVLLYASWGDEEFEYKALALACVGILLLVLWRFRLLLQVVDEQSMVLTSLARTDSLTGLPNRRTLDFELERLEQQATLDGTALTIAMLDLDHFKEYNDLHGHPAGDAALAACAKSWASELEAPAFIARYGGEEFAVLLPGIGLLRAEPLLQRLRLATPARQTVSIGFAERRPGESGFETMSRADRALYLAKQMGRNRVQADGAAATIA